MPRYWVIAPHESDPPGLFEKAWQFDLTNNLISIGWAKLGDVSKMSKQELAKAVASTYPERPPQTKALITNMIWAFYHEIGPGDFVIARRGRKILAAVGNVTQSAFYSAGKNPHIDHPNFLGVSWQELPRDKDFPSIVFPMHTLALVSDEVALKLLQDGSPDVSVDAAGKIEDPQAFVLEKYLEDFIVSNLSPALLHHPSVYVGAIRKRADREDSLVFINGPGLAYQLLPLDVRPEFTRSGPSTGPRLSFGIAACLI